MFRHWGIHNVLKGEGRANGKNQHINQVLPPVLLWDFRTRVALLRLIIHSDFSFNTRHAFKTWLLTYVNHNFQLTNVSEIRNEHQTSRCITILGSFPFVPLPQNVMHPQLRSTCHYIANHYLPIWHEGTGGGGGGGGGLHIICTHWAGGGGRPHFLSFDRNNIVLVKHMLIWLLLKAYLE